MALNTEDQLTLFAGDSLAKTSARLENRLDLAEKEAPYTAKCLELLASVCRDTQFLKTSQGSLLETKGDGSQDFSMTWPRSGTMRSGTVYRLPSLAPPITEIGSGLLPTPNAVDGPKWHYTISPDMVKKRMRCGRQLMLAHWSVMAVGRTGKSNPEFASLLMGFPMGYTDVSRQETQ